MDILRIILAAFAGYLLGSANASLIVGKFYGVDVRKHGSGNAGATNTLRTLGKKAAILVGLGDVLKGVAACILGLIIAGDAGLMAGGAGAVLGHNWPVFFGFKGGKGIFTTFAVILMMDWRIGLILLGLFIIIVAITRYISLGSVICAVLFPVVGVLLGKNAEFIIFAALLGLLAVERHKTNISRLLNGTESKFSLSKKKE
ncbi:MAG: glycerol-3-phosphate 1-O-acyltransferase PlsY [Clostridia bacterium]|nr:glycerol-3-phosphate 1-O-acyltransferase PlsY [Clostridia bacterium]